MNTFIIPGGQAHLARISNYLNDDVCGILIHEKIDADAIKLSGINTKEITKKIYTLNTLLRVTAERIEERDKWFCEKCLNNILSDPRVHYLAARSYFNSAFNNAIAIEKILVNSVLIIRRTNPSRLISSSTPHSLEAWIFAKCFEYLNLPIYILERTPLSGRAWIYRGLDAQAVVPFTRDSAKEGLTESTLKIVKEQRNSKPGAKDKDGFYISRMELNSIKGADSSNLWSYKREISYLFSGRIITLPVRLLSFYLKRYLYESYCNASIKELPEGPFVIYFMHYQSERSSLPEGLSYAQQWFAIRLLSWSLPDGWKLLVREHPTTWLKPLDIAVRTKSLYKEIALLENTKLCSMDVDTFELIDRSEAVVTLTGHVGFQAILRNKPTIVFGLPAYKDHPACFSIKSINDLAKAISVIQKDDLGDCFTDDALNNYLSWIEQNSLSAQPDDTDIMEARLKNFTEMYKQILSGNIELQ